MTEINGFKCDRCGSFVIKRSDIFKIIQLNKETFDLCSYCAYRIKKDLNIWSEKREAGRNGM